MVGLGITEMGKIYGRSAADFAAEAVALALDDAGLQKSDIDGLLINGNGNVDMDPRLQMALGFEDLTMLNVMSAAGSTSGAMVQYARYSRSTRAWRATSCCSTPTRRSGERRPPPRRTRAAAPGTA